MFVGRYTVGLRELGPKFKASSNDIQLKLIETGELNC